MARAIFDSELPVISAVGHETDFTIADFVADLRAPTPSAAAELAVANIADIKEGLKKYNNRLCIALNKKLELMKLQYEKIMTSKAFREPYQKIEEEKIKLQNNIKLMYDKVFDQYTKSNNSFTNVISKLDSLSPLKTLSRGYSLVQKNGKIVRSKDELAKGDIVSIRLQDGEASATIK